MQSEEERRMLEEKISSIAEEKEAIQLEKGTTTES